MSETDHVDRSKMVLPKNVVLGEAKKADEDEECVFTMRAKVFRFVEKEILGGEEILNQWKERGTGDCKFMKHKESGEVRFLLRQDKTLKLCGNFLISSSIELQSNVGSDRSWLMNVMDFSDEATGKAEIFAIRFRNAENANIFKDEFEKAQKANDEAKKAPVEEKKEEEKTEEKKEEEKTEEKTEEKKE
eukprot:TRINITY_DN425826_c0_g1_i1.p1 TRINITY_DN425826_c0_g1~~TRINITY_DN425826_c0_g1_i1.p1  ORF type:complete len:209 (-),score=70.63 TRINITY_DN425826_c0_g1_i1:196-762(-)